MVSKLIETCAFKKKFSRLDCYPLNLLSAQCSISTLFPALQLRIIASKALNWVSVHILRSLRVLLPPERPLPATGKFLCSVVGIKLEEFKSDEYKLEECKLKDFRFESSLSVVTQNKWCRGAGWLIRGQTFWSKLTRETFSVAISLCRKITFVYRANAEIRGRWEMKVPVVLHYNSEIEITHLSFWNLQIRKLYYCPTLF